MNFKFVIIGNTSGMLVLPNVKLEDEKVSRLIVEEHFGIFYKDNSNSI